MGEMHRVGIYQLLPAAMFRKITGHFPGPALLMDISVSCRSRKTRCQVEIDAGTYHQRLYLFQLAGRAELAVKIKADPIIKFIILKSSQPAGELRLRITRHQAFEKKDAYE